jgi:hypothetical protein
MKDTGKFLLFWQKKYGLKEPKLATIGGLFDPGEKDGLTVLLNLL